MKVFRKSLALLAALIILTLSLPLFAGAEEVQPETVYVGTEGAYAPFTFINEKGELDGFDIAVVRALDALIPELSFSFVPTEWSSIFVALEAGNFDIIANQIARNSDREAKYLFSQTPYAWSASAIIYADGRTDIADIQSLHGKTVTAGLGSANTTWLEQYNADHGNPINVAYSDGGVSKMLQDILNGRADATLNNPITTSLIAKAQGLAVDWTVWTDNGIIPVYLLYANNEKGQRIQALVEPALQQLLVDGTLKALSVQYLGADYATKEAVEAQGAQ